MQNSACHEQRNTVPKPWETQGGDSSLPLLMRVGTSGYTSQTSCSPVQTWISDTDTPITLSNRKGLSWSPSVSIAIKRSLSCVSSLAHFIDLPGRWCSSQRMLVLHLCNWLSLFKNASICKSLRAESVILWGLNTLQMFPFKNLSRCIWAISPPLSILRQSNCARLMPQYCVKGSLSCASRRFRKPGRLSVGPS